MSTNLFESVLRQQYALMLTGELSDFNIVVDRRIFRVHKFILGSRSPYFKALFASNMLETWENRLTLVDVEIEIFEKFLEFVYTLGVDKLDNESALKLMLCGDKYGMPDLVETCESHLMTNKNARMALRTLLLADLFQRNNLKESMKRFVAQRWDLVFETDGWSDVVRNHSLMTELVQSELSKMIEGPKVGKLEIRSSTPLTRTWRVSTSEVTLAESDYVESLRFSIHDDTSDLAWKFGLHFVDDTFVIYIIHEGLPEIHPVACNFVVSKSDDSQLCSGTITTSCCFDGAISCRKLLVALANVSSADHDQIFVDVTLLTRTNASGQPPTMNYFDEYLKSSSQTDAVVEAGGERFSVHKVVLSSASRVFADKFLQYRALYKLGDINPRTFRKLLTLIYGEDEKTESYDFELLDSAKMFKLSEKIINRCRASLMRRVRRETAVEFLVEAHHRRDASLRLMVIKYIANLLRSSEPPTNWDMLEDYPELHEELLQFLIYQSRLAMQQYQMIDFATKR